jgi:pimeloyl-ACP methyl ester carboxylesterase
VAVPTLYARAEDGAHIAYQVIGDGPLDVVSVPGFVSNVEVAWEMPFIRSQIERIASFARLIRFDKRGTGLSDRGDGIPTLERRMEDLHDVMDAAGSERAALWGVSEGGAMCMLFAATYPERTNALVLMSSFARVIDGDGQAFGIPHEMADAITQAWVDDWGSGKVLGAFFPSAAGNPTMTELFARYERNSARPGDVRAITEMAAGIDLRAVLPSINVPTMVVHHTGDPMIAVEHGRYLAAHIPGARYVELPDADHATIAEDAPDAFDDIREFLTGVRRTPASSERLLATILFTDIVGSTDRAAAVGDQRWRALLDRHDDAVRVELRRHRGREIKTTGDGFLAAFDGPARAVECAVATIEAVRQLGLDSRAGVHTGECEQRGDDLGGIAVHIGARVAALAQPNEVLVSRTVTDLVAGSGLCFVDRGEFELKGVPNRWQLFAVSS